MQVFENGTRFVWYDGGTAVRCAVGGLVSAESIMTALFHGFVVSGSTGFDVGTHDGDMWLRQRGHPAVRFSPPEMRLESIRWSHGGTSKAGHFQFCFQVPSRGSKPAKCIWEHSSCLCHPAFTVRAIEVFTVRVDGKRRFGSGLD